jgi:hypothetical protein
MTRNIRFAVVSAAALFAVGMSVAAVPAPLRAWEDPGSDAVSTAGDVASGAGNVASDAATGAGNIASGAGHVASDAAVGAGNVAGEVAGPIPRKAGRIAGDAAEAGGSIAKKTLDLTSEILDSIF